MANFYDTLETRSADQRDADNAKALTDIIAHAKANAPGWGRLTDVDARDINNLSDLSKLPILRKSALVEMQAEDPPFGGLVAGTPHHVFQSPGPINEPGGITHDWWRMGRFLHAAGIGAGDLMQNCFAYHLTPAGMMFENGAAAVGAQVFPAGTGQTEAQAQAMTALGVTGYAGTPDYLKVILEKADELGLDSSRVKKATVSGGPLFPQLRSWYEDRGIACLQCYATADLGNIAYESAAMDGMIVDEGVLVEIVTPGTGTPVAAGEIGEVVVTSFNKDYPLIRFATGDLSAVMPGQSPCGRTNTRIVGWRGRADQAAKVKGMFVRPEQVADFVARNEGVERARVVITRDGDTDAMEVRVEGAGDSAGLENSVREVLKLRGTVTMVATGDLPRDGVVIEDARPVDG